MPPPWKSLKELITHLGQQRAKEEPLSTFFSIPVSSQDFYKGRNLIKMRSGVERTANEHSPQGGESRNPAGS